jgi:hypothetical protein
MEFGLASLLELLVIALAMIFYVRPERTRPVFSFLLFTAFLVAFVAMIWAVKMGH